MKLKEINIKLGALLDLKGRTRVIESEGKPVKDAFEPYVFAQATKVNIITNIAALRPGNEVYVEAQKQLIAELSPDGTAKAIDDNPHLGKEYIRRHNDLLNTEYPKAIRLFKIRWTELEQAKVDPVTIANLGKLVHEMPAAADADLFVEEAPVAPVTLPKPAPAVPAT